MYVKIITDLSVEPVTLQEAKDWMKVVDYTYDDSMITNLIKSTRILLEEYTGLSFGTKTIEAIYDIKEVSEVPYSPLQSMTSVYRRNNEAWELMNVNQDYWIIADSIKVAYPGMYKLRYQAGYTTLPEALKTDIKVLVGWQYENRGIRFNERGNATVNPFLNILNAPKFKKVVI